MTALKAGMVLGTVLLFTSAAYAMDLDKSRTLERLERQVRRELVTLPYYNLFDTFSFQVDGDVITLTGKVTRPTLKSDAERVVKKIEGVSQVINRIDVLPLSSNDDRLRMSLYRAIYGHSALELYSIRAVPPIHIIVENGHVTLEGMVDNAMQKNIAEVQARSVAGVFSVTNNLRTDAEN